MLADTLQENTTYTCLVFDKRVTTLKEIEESTTKRKNYSTEVKVEVYVAKSTKKTCSENCIGGAVWPTTMQGKTASTICQPTHEGRRSIKCNPTRLATEPIWSDNVDNEECIKTSFVEYFRELELLFGGYVKKAEDYKKPYNYLRHLHDEAKSQQPTHAEWKGNFEMIRKSLKVIQCSQICWACTCLIYWIFHFQYLKKRNDLSLDYEELSEEFFGGILPWLVGKRVTSTYLEVGPAQTGNIFKIYSLINESVPLFGLRVHANSSRFTLAVENPGGDDKNIQFFKPQQIIQKSKK